MRTPVAIGSLLLGGAFPIALLGSAAGAQLMAESAVVGDAIPASLTGKPGDAGRGRDIVFSRERGNCPICHVVPAADETLHGDVGPSLRGIADRLSEGQVRLRVVDGRRLNASSIMPSYYRMDGLKRVAAAYAGKPVLTAQEVEDVVAFLMTLREDKR